MPDLAAAAAAGPASTAAYGARCIGPAHDDTPAFQAAIDTGHTVYAPAMGGHCHITHALVMRTPGQIFGGDGRARTRIEIEPGFTGDGVFVAKTGEPGPVWRDFSVSFAQPDTDDRKDLVRYPAAISAENTPRFQMEGLGCFKATVCVKMVGNSGGSTISQLQFAAFMIGIQIDGSLDTVRILAPHWFPFTMTSKQMKIFVDDCSTSPVAIDAGHVDDLVVDDGLFLGGLALKMHRSASGLPFGSIHNTDFDTTSGIWLMEGNLIASSSYFNIGRAKCYALRQDAGTLILGEDNFLTSVQTGGALIDLHGGQTTITASGFGTGTQDVVVVSLNETAHLLLSSNHFSRQPGKDYENPLIVLREESHLVSMGNFVDDKGGGHGVVFQTNGISPRFSSTGDTSRGWQPRQALAR